MMAFHTDPPFTPPVPPEDRSTSRATRKPPPIGKHTSDEALYSFFAEHQDQHSFRLLYDRYYQRNRRFFQKWLRDESVADDLTQEVFRRLVNFAPRFRPDQSFSSFQHTVVRNVLKGHYRTVSRDRLTCFSDVANRPLGVRSPTDRAAFRDPMDPPAKNYAPDVDAYRAEVSAAITSAVEALEGEYRRPFEMYHLQGLPFEDIARRENIPVGTAKSRVHRARLQLRKILTEFQAEH